MNPLAFFVITLLALSSAQGQVKINQLPEATSAAQSDVTVIVTGTITKKMTFANLGITLQIPATSTQLSNGSIIIGGTDGKGHGQTITGDATIDDTGALTLGSVATGGTYQTTGSGSIVIDSKGRVISIASTTNALLTAGSFALTGTYTGGTFVSGSFTGDGSGLLNLTGTSVTGTVHAASIVNGISNSGTIVASGSLGSSGSNSLTGSNSTLKLGSGTISVNPASSGSIALQTGGVLVNGNPVGPQKFGALVIDGNSLFSFYAAKPFWSNSNLQGVTITSFAVGGQTLSGMLSGYATGPHTLRPSVTGKPTALLFNEVFNAINNDHENAATIESQLVAYSGSAHVDGMFVIAFTPPPSSILSTSGQAVYTAVKNWMIDPSGTGGAQYFDQEVRTDLIFPDPSDATIFSGSLHLTSLAHSILWKDIQTTGSASIGVKDNGPTYFSGERVIDYGAGGAQLNFPTGTGTDGPALADASGVIRDLVGNVVVDNSGNIFSHSAGVADATQVGNLNNGEYFDSDNGLILTQVETLTTPGGNGGPSMWNNNGVPMFGDYLSGPWVPIQVTGTLASGTWSHSDAAITGSNCTLQLTGSATLPPYITVSGTTATVHSGTNTGATFIFSINATQ